MYICIIVCAQSRAQDEPRWQQDGRLARTMLYEIGTKMGARTETKTKKTQRKK